MKKIIKPGQLITVNNIIYRCRKRPDFSFWENGYSYERNTKIQFP